MCTCFQFVYIIRDNANNRNQIIQPLDNTAIRKLIGQPMENVI